MSKIYRIDMSNLSTEEFHDIYKRIDTHAFTYDEVAPFTYEVAWNSSAPIADRLNISADRITPVM